jgi:general secretion pathway protein J
MTAARRIRNRGFTLVEVLVALLLLAILTTFAWQGLDGVLRAREAGRESVDATSRLATVLTQWEQDLQAVADTELVPAITFDGQTLRLTRRAEDGIVLVAWAVRGQRWQRWASQPMQRVGALQQAWLASQQFLGNEAGQLTVADGVSEWQIYFFRGGAWSNAQSAAELVPGSTAPLPTPPASPPPAPPPPGSPPPDAPPGQAGGGTAPPPAAAPLPRALRAELPQAVRLVITLKPGKLTRDVALGPSGT